MDLKIKQNWHNFFALYQKSGMTKEDFCRSQKIASSRFFYYAKMHRDTEIPKETSKAALFLPVSTKKDFTIKINKLSKPVFRIHS